VAIVGGGITGAVVAQRFVAAGVGVALIEAQLVGRGSTAASSALLLQEPDQGLWELTRRHGRAAGRRIWSLSRDAVAELIDTLTRVRANCDLVRRETVYVARSAQQAADLQRELRQRRHAGFDGEWLSTATLKRQTGLAAHGAILTAGNAQLNPYKACVELVRAATRAGARVFERSPVTRIERLRDGVRVHTRHGRVDARRVVIATGYATTRFRPLAGRFRMFRTYVATTAPMDASTRRAVRFGDVMMWDAERPYHYARWTADHRLLVGGGDRRARGGPSRNVRVARAAASLRSEFATLVPEAEPLAFELAWEGLFALTPDSLPYVGPHRRYPRHLFALGYGGNGMTFASLAARILFEQWGGGHLAHHDLFAFGRFR
jgi:glycine/D-amino acid oxidase-like deaminating enzyme